MFFSFASKNFMKILKASKLSWAGQLWALGPYKIILGLT